MTASEAKKIFEAVALANKHPDPVAYSEKALEAWKNPAAIVEQQKITQEGE